MTPRDDDGDAMPGQDSFIDVICNMVGILIVLVMVVGARASRSRQPDDPEPVVAAVSVESPQDLSELQREIEQATLAANRLHDQTEDRFAAAIRMRAQSAAIEQERAELAQTRALAEKEIEARRAKLDSEDQNKFDLQRRIDAAQIKLASLTDERLTLVKAPVELTEIECVPTPLASAVRDTEIHVRIKHGDLAVLPVERLLREGLQQHGAHIRSSLKSRGEAYDVFGPMDGFRMRLTVAYEEEIVPPGTQQPRPSEPFLHAVFLPTSDRLGLSIEQALLPTAPLAQAIKLKRAESPMVVAWVYPDSFSALNRLKEAMWEAGMPLAVWTLTKERLIEFDTRGSKRAAQ